MLQQVMKAPESPARMQVSLLVLSRNYDAKEPSSQHEYTFKNQADFTQIRSFKR